MKLLPFFLGFVIDDGGDFGLKKSGRFERRFVHHFQKVILANQVHAFIQNLVSVDFGQLQRPKVVQPHLLQILLSRISAEEIVDSADVVVHELVSKSRHRFLVMHFVPVLRA